MLRRKVYVNAAKLRLLKCLGLEDEDMRWFTSNEHESNIHVAPMWTLASFKRLKHISTQYAVRAVAFFSLHILMLACTYLQCISLHILILLSNLHFHIKTMYVKILCFCFCIIKYLEEWN